MARFAQIASVGSLAVRRFTTWRAFSSHRAFATAFLVAIAIFFSSMVQDFAGIASLHIWNGRVFVTPLSSMSLTRSSLPMEAGHSSQIQVAHGSHPSNQIL
jgi:hypothetical protein